MADLHAKIRPAQRDELPAINALILRAKAHWGYDADFMAAATAELTVPASALGPDLVVWADPAPLGMAQLIVTGDRAKLDDLFIDPSAMGRGIGAQLFHWAALRAKSQGAKVMEIISDPFAEAFYLHVGASRVGDEPSGSIPGRLLPRLHFDLTADHTLGQHDA